jgi:dihydropteroate synthase
MLLHCGRNVLDLTTPVVMGIVNVTPDSFSDGGRWLDPAHAVEHALQLIDQGAGIIDVGGESTRPGATAVSGDEELQRVLPVVDALAKRTAIPISVDTSRANVIRAVVDAGASLINDIRALREPGAFDAVAATHAGVCLMHMQGEPRTMQVAPTYSDVVKDVRQFLVERVAACEKAGIARERIAIDPGIGFGKSLEHNLALLANLDALTQLNLPILIGISRKSLLGTLTGRAMESRLYGGIAANTAAILAGASIIRVHDVAETVDAVKVACAIRQAKQPMPRTKQELGS